MAKLPSKKKFAKIMWEEMERVIELVGSRRRFAKISGLNYGDIYYYKSGRIIGTETAFRAFSKLAKKGIGIDVKKLCGFHLACCGVNVDGSLEKM